MVLVSMGMNDFCDESRWLIAPNDLRNPLIGQEYHPLRKLFILKSGLLAVYLWKT